MPSKKHQLRFVVDDDQLCVIRGKASELGVPVSSYMRNCALDRPLPRRTRSLALNDYDDCVTLTRAISIVSRARRTAEDETCYQRLCEMAGRIVKK